MTLLNQVTLIGNVVRDFHVRKTASNAEVTNLEIILDNPASPDKKTFVNVTAWDKLAETMASRLKKGSKVFLQGRLNTDSSIDKVTGETFSSLIVTATGFLDLTVRK